MNPRIVLLLNGDPDVERAAEEAVLESRHGLRVARTSRDALGILRDGLDDVDLIIVDLDPSIHGVTLLGAIEGCRDPAPIVALTSLEQEYMRPLAAAKCVAECLGKPVTTAQFEKLIARFCSAATL
jgi:DNA-binding NtrC family response regulator